MNLRRVIVVLAAAAAMVAAVPAALSSVPDPQVVAEPCIDGVMPGNPYVANCNLPTRGPRVRGQAPDAAAIIACRNIPGCLALYVNHPGWTVWGPPGFIP